MTARLFWLKCLGDYWRYTCRVGQQRSGDERGGCLSRASSGAQAMASGHFGLYLNHTVLLYEIMGNKRARSTSRTRVYDSPRGDRVDGGLGRTRGYRSVVGSSRPAAPAVALSKPSGLASTSPSADSLATTKDDTHDDDDDDDDPRTDSRAREPIDLRALCNPGGGGRSPHYVRARAISVVAARVDARTIDARATCSWSRTIVDDDGDATPTTGSSLPVSSTKDLGRALGWPLGALAAQYAHAAVAAVW